MTLLGSSGSAYWFLTRGSGVVTLVLLTASVCLGVVTTIRWRSTRLPRFLVAGLHRNVTLLAVAFLAIHVVTTLLDAYAPIHLQDVFVPFLSQYRPVWLGLGALSLDLILAVMVTSLLRARLGYGIWRMTHWLAYASWPLALLHSLGTGSDTRTSWLPLLAFVCVGAVTLSVLTRVLHASGDPARRAAIAGSALVLPVAIFLWYQSGPGQAGWAAKAGTPAGLIRSASVTSGTASKTVSTAAQSRNQMPSSFTARLAGKLTESASDAQGIVTLHIDTAVRGGLQGTLRLALRGIPTDDGGVTMTSSGVAFAAKHTPVFEGSIVGLNGTDVNAEVASSSGGRYQLALSLNVDSTTNAVTGIVRGERA